MLSATLSPETQRYKRSIYCPFGSGTQPTRLKRLYEENRLGMFFHLPCQAREPTDGLLPRERKIGRSFSFEHLVDVKAKDLLAAFLERILLLSG